MGRRGIRRICRHRYHHHRAMGNSEHRPIHPQYRRIRVGRPQFNQKDSQGALHLWHTTLPHRQLQSQLLTGRRLLLQLMPLMGQALLLRQWRIMRLLMAYHKRNHTLAYRKGSPTPAYQAQCPLLMGITAPHHQAVLPRIVLLLQPLLLMVHLPGHKATATTLPSHRRIRYTELLPLHHMFHVRPVLPVLGVGTK